eukprot:TRINITY_DN14549_c0_g1_i1.p1 TRINITY_DN14549_c0_g1~~TRINITY_DN14549_c0_g1_i1.p1  ORF type:complete len:427 (+),score=85.28 TRINITY_DN14549_c0_g1_i1:85-1281(+)
MASTAAPSRPHHVLILGGAVALAVFAYPERSSCAQPLNAVLVNGSNSYGQLGVGDDRNKLVPTRVDALQGLPIKAVACGGNQTAVILATGEVYTFGAGRDYALGHGDDTNESLPRMVAGLSSVPVKQVSVGRQHMAAVTTSGHVYTWGRGIGGRLGHGDMSDVTVPKQVAAIADKRVVQVACGTIYTAAIDDTGKLYVWGRKIFGRGGNSQVSGPALVQTIPERVVQVDCGEAHIIAVGASGKVYTWGGDEYGQLGLGSRVDIEQPTVVSALTGKQVVSVAAGDYHSVALTAQGEVFTWGLNREGELGHGNTADARTPRLVNALSDQKLVVKQVAAGGAHTVVVDANGRAWVFGKGRDGQLGLNEVAFRLEPQQLTTVSAPILSIDCGENHTAAVVQA